MNKKDIIEFQTELAGWVGVLCILLAYGLLTFDILAAHDTAYHALNLIGGLGIIIDAVADRNWQPAALNIVWIAIAVYAISTNFL